jgi:hypothetical protein
MTSAQRDGAAPPSPTSAVVVRDKAGTLLVMESTLPHPPLPALELELDCELGYFELYDAASPPPGRGWGCASAEAWADAREGSRIRYETLAPRPLRIRLEAIEDDNTARTPTDDDDEDTLDEDGDEEALDEDALDDPLAGYHLAHPAGRWLRCSSARLLASDGVATIELPWAAGDWRLLWFARPELSLYAHSRERLTPLGDQPDHILLLERLAPTDQRPLADLESCYAAYRAWYAVQQLDDPAALQAVLNADDPEGVARHAALRRLAQLGDPGRTVLLAIAAAGDLCGVIARRLLHTPPMAIDRTLLPDPNEPTGA